MNKLSVLFDHQAFEMQKFGGISRYFYELIKHLPIETQLSLRVSTNYYLNSDSVRHYPGIYAPERLYKWFKGPVKRWNRSFSIQELQDNSCSVFHPTYYNPYFLPYVGSKPYVITVHDMNHELFPQYFSNAEQMIAWKKETITHASRIIAISENTKEDIIRLLQVNPEKIDVVYHGISQIKTTYSELKLPERYILYVGDRGGYKNFARLLSVFSRIVSSERNLCLVCTGKSLKAYEWKQIEALGIKANVLYVKANDLELGQLYQQAALLVYPSLYEGFGIPLLEAYVNDCPVALSAASCFPEIAGDAGSYFDPENEDSMFLSIRNILVDTDLRMSLIEKGRKRLPLYTWEKTAEKTLSVYEKIVPSSTFDL